LTPQLSTTLHYIIHILSPIVPLTYAILPLPASLDPSQTLTILSNAQNTLRLASLSRTAVLRDPMLSDALHQNGLQEAQLMELARQDRGVRKEIVDYRLDQEGIRNNARMWVTQGWTGLMGSTTATEAQTAQAIL
jgi:hypothetical protein